MFTKMIDNKYHMTGVSQENHKSISIMMQVLQISEISYSLHYMNIRQSFINKFAQDKCVNGQTAPNYVLIIQVANSTYKAEICCIT